MERNKNVQTWATAFSTHADNGRKIIFRYAEHISPVFELASQPDRIIIVWKYKSETGLPLADDFEQMNLLEDHLEPATEAGSVATLALVSTGENLREWTYYARSGDDFMDRMNGALAGMPAFPIEIHIASDPMWKTYSDFRDEVKSLAS
jgi:hypothetical protein